jgi:hypothetical protein
MYWIGLVNGDRGIKSHSCKGDEWSKNSMRV